MTRYVLKRVLLAIVTIIIVSLITFFAMNAVPGGPFNQEKAPSPQVKAVLEARYNLDKPVGEQYLLYMGNILKGDWGVSLKTGREIADTLGPRFLVSAQLGVQAAVVAVIFGLVLGSIAALNRNKLPDRIIIFFTTLFTGVPSFVLATLLLLVFCVQLQWFPVWSAENPNYVLPVVSLALYPMAYITRLTKTSMLDALSQDYVRTARAKGVPQVKVIFKHALRNALIPVITYVGPWSRPSSPVRWSLKTSSPSAAWAASSSAASTTATTRSSWPPPLFLGTLMISANLITDLVYKVIDPRIELE